MIISMFVKNTEYWLYFDDSGKLENYNDDYIIYGGVLFSNPNKKDNFCKEFKLAKSKISNDQNKEIKGNEIVTKFIKFSQSPYKRANIENLISKFKLTDYNFHIFIPKKELYEHVKNQEHVRNFSIGLLIKKMIENGQIKPNSVLNIFLDAEKWDTKAKEEFELSNYLNEQFPSSKIISFLRLNKITVQTVECVDSKKVVEIQAADIIANFAFKFHMRNKYSKEIWDCLDRYIVKIMAVKFPNIEVFEDTREISYKDLDGIQDS